MAYLLRPDLYETREAVVRVVRVVHKNPGIAKGALMAHHEAKGTRSTNISAAIAEAVRQGFIREERPGGSKIEHYPTGAVPDGF